MANELKITNAFRFSKNTVRFDITDTDQYIDVSGDHSIYRTQEIGTTSEALDIGEITTVGWAFFRNLDNTNYIEIGYYDTIFRNLIKLKAEEYCICRLGQNAPYAQANTAAADLEYIFIED